MRKKGGKIMPRRDGTGPMGIGAMTGRGIGYGYGYGCGRGNRRQFCVAGTPGYLRNNYLQNSVQMDEKMLWCNQETLLENQLKQIKDRLSKLGKESE
jgi:hypothetical protein